jgi:eukaryotic-like serine/threonine-protein kinase
VHRDVKPGNVLIAEDGRVKLTDFGVSRAVDDVQLTRTGLIAGTPAFLSPEVARGQTPTAASDVFALGATLYAAVEGRPPFGLDDNAYALLHKVATSTPDPPQQAGALTSLIMRLLADDPAERPTASEAREILGAIAEGRSTVGGAAPEGTAVLDAGLATAAVNGGRTAVAYQDARPADRPELVATAAGVPPVIAPRPPREAGDGADGPGGSRPRPVLLALVALAVVGIGILVAVLVRGNGDPNAAAPPAAAPSSVAAAPAPAAVPSAAATTELAPTTSAAPTTTAAPTTEPTPTPGAGTAADPVGFVQNYYGLLPGNTSAAWNLLGSTAQSQSGGRDGFERFYGGLARVWVENLRVNGNTVTGTVVFTRKDGSVSREGYQFVLGEDDGRQVIQSFSRA